LQQARELAVTVGNVAGLGSNKCGNDVAQRRQRRVDLGCFGEPITGSAGFALPFTSRQIHKIEFSGAKTFLAV